MTWLVDADITEPVIATGVVATGGTESLVNINGQVYRVHEYTSSDNFVVSGSGEVEVFAVGGGGGGGIAYPDFTKSDDYLIATGGGGGGGVINCNVTLSVGSHSIAIGAGSSPAFTPYAKGGDSKISIGGTDLVVAYGGFNAAGMEIVRAGAPPEPSINPIEAGQGASPTNIGGSSGGGAYCRTESVLVASVETASTTATIGQGNVGGDPISSLFNFASGGGGGGSLGKGKQGGIDTPATGGNGITTFIKGFPQTFGAGGGSGSYNLPRAFGGLGGGGAGAAIGAVPTSGQANTGGGGGGTFESEPPQPSGLGGGNPGSGGSGIVIIRYPIEA